MWPVMAHVGIGAVRADARTLLVIRPRKPDDQTSGSPSAGRREPTSLLQMR